MSRGVGLLALLALSACGHDDGASISTQALIVTGHCQVTANGVTAAGDDVTGDLRDVAGTPTGTWTNTGSDTFTATSNWLECRVNGSTVADFTGGGSWNGTPGYTYRVHVQDRGTPGSPVRVEGPPTTQTIVASRTYAPTHFDDGTASWDAGAYATIPSALPVTTGNAANGWATVTFAPDPGGAASLAYAVRCRYRGGSHSGDPDTASEIAAGASYAFVDCQRPCSTVPGDDDDDDHDVDEDHHSDEHHASGDRDHDHNHGCGGYEHGGHFYARGDDHHACDRDDDDGEHDSWCTDPDVASGAQLLVSSATVHVDSGANDLPSRRAAQTVVTVDLAVQAFTWVAPENDYYRLAIWDPSGALVHSSDGDLASGDITVTLLP